MKRAWEYDRELILSAKPVVLSEEEQGWDLAAQLDDGEYNKLRFLWESAVPGSGAPERVFLAAIQSMYNMGYDVTAAERLIPDCLEALTRDDRVTLSRLTARIWSILNGAPKIDGHPYWKYSRYDSFADVEQEVEFVTYPGFALSDAELYEKIYAGWIAQIAGAAMGTAVEGYTAKAIREAFGEVRDYVRPPNTMNDDITFELAFLEAFGRSGYAVTADEIADEWVGRIPMGWSAEDAALRNLRMGIRPPESGRIANPWREWIGAQMRGAVCGMAAPADPQAAARLAFCDATVSHHNNGALGEVFNALLCSCAFVEKEVADVLTKSIGMIPQKSEYYSVLDFAYKACLAAPSWREAWAACDEKYKEYNWIHAYPNAAAEVVALYFCNNSFDECMHIIAMVGMDVDCNAAQIGTVFGILHGLEGIGAKWRDPIGDELYTYVRGYEKGSITALAQKTADCVARAKKLRQN